MSENRVFAFFDVEHLHLVDFSATLETSTETVRRSVDGTKTFVKWEGQEPSFVSQIPNVTVLDYDDTCSLLKTPEWHFDPSHMMNEIGDTNISVLE